MGSRRAREAEIASLFSEIQEPLLLLDDESLHFSEEERECEAASP